MPKDSYDYEFKPTHELTPGASTDDYDFPCSYSWICEPIFMLAVSKNDQQPVKLFQAASNEHTMLSVPDGYDLHADHVSDREVRLTVSKHIDPKSLKPRKED